MPWPVPVAAAPAHTPTSPAILTAGAAGTTSGFVYYNKTAAILEAALGVVAGTPAIVNGLAVSAGSGLTANIATGWAVLDGLVDVATALTYSCPVSTTAYLWLRQNGTITHTTSTTPPSGKAVYLGNVTTNASAITAVSLLGVVKFSGGMLWRETNEAGAPADSPPAALRMWTKTTGGLYLWTGAAWTKLD